MPDISPTNKWVTVAVSDTVDLTLYTQRQELTDAIYVGNGGGDVALVDQSNDVTVFTAVPAGTTLRVGARRVNATGTTATSILALYWV
jgi:hypothetical protein